jgi:hypothetical protein
MRMDYRRSPEYGATRASTKAGERYERLVEDVLRKTIRLNPERKSYYILPQFPTNGGFCDFGVWPQGSPHDLFLIEVKSQWSLDAYRQLRHYASGEHSGARRVCICKVHHPNIRPEPFECLPLPRLMDAQPGKLTIIPWSGRKTIT